jgi:glycosyltransferase involved in cell wall biosynthesis
MQFPDSEYVVILDPKGVIPGGGPHVISRHEDYCRRLLGRTQNEVSLVVLTRLVNEAVDSESTSALVFYESMMDWLRGVIAFLHNHGPKIRTIIVGDPWQSFWISRLLVYFTRVECRFQVQFHGDFFNKKWKSLSMKNRFASFTLPKVVGWSDSLRFVGDRQMKNALTSRPEIMDKSFVSSIAPILGEFESRTFTTQSFFTLGVIGRLHDDRGIDSVLRLLSCISRKGFSFRVVFVGDGPKRKFIELSLRDLGIDFVMRGNLYGSALEDAWREIDVVISMAPAESFGLVPREALSRGKRVIGLSNSGLEELRQGISQTAGLELLDADWNCESVERSLDALQNHCPTNEAREAIESQGRESIEKLLESWL